MSILTLFTPCPQAEEEEEMPLILQKPTDFTSMHSDSVYFPDEADTDQTALETAGWLRCGPATDPCTFSVSSGALNIVAPSAHTNNIVCGAMIPVTGVGSTDLFDVVVVFEPYSNLLAATESPPYDATFAIGVVDTASNNLYTTYGLNYATTKRIYRTTVAGDYTTGAPGTTAYVTWSGGHTPFCMRIRKNGATLYYGFPNLTTVGGFLPTNKYPNGAALEEDDYVEHGTVAHSEPVTHLFVGMQKRSGYYDLSAKIRGIYRVE